MKREVAAEIVDSLKDAGVDFVATLTEANLHDLVMALGEDKAIHHVPVTREEEGIGICAGAYLGGKKPAMVMMNAGFLLSTNALAAVSTFTCGGTLMSANGGITLAMRCSMYRGFRKPPRLHPRRLSSYTPISKVASHYHGRFEDIRPTIRDSQMLARSSRRPTAIVLNKQALR